MMWLVLVAAGIVYARMRGIPSRIAIPIIAAFLIEAPLYLAPSLKVRVPRRRGWSDGNWRLCWP